MRIHYQNRHGEEVMLTNVIHLQNLDNETWEALLSNGHTLTLLTKSIEGIYYKDKEGQNELAY